MTIRTGIGLTLFVLGGAMALLNFYLSWIRVPLLRKLGRPHKWVSGVPLLGSTLLAASAVLLRAHVGGTAAPLALIAIDTGGPLWFVLTMLFAWWRGPFTRSP